MNGRPIVVGAQLSRNIKRLCLLSVHIYIYILISQVYIRRVPQTK